MMVCWFLETTSWGLEPLSSKPECLVLFYGLHCLWT
ncbi:hypothetical protein Godav_019836, partial [Gossypium davidsonii]|nr:hypothetical protein [Gossypium davidsonii]